MSRKRSKRSRYRQAPGAVPGTLVAAPFSSPTEVRLIRYHGSEFKETCPSPLDFAELALRNDILWVDVDGLADAELVQKLGDHFHIHRLAMEDVLYSHQSKADDFGSHLQICFSTLADDTAATEPISMFVGPNFILTFQAGIPGDPFEAVRGRLRESRGMIRDKGPDYLAYALLDATIDAYFPVVDQWTDQLVAYEELVMDRPSAELWAKICGLRTHVLTLRRTLRHFREAVAILLSYEGPLIQDYTRPYYRDLHDHLLELVEALEGLRETTGELMQTFHARQSQKTNDIMQVLTIISTIFIPLTFVAGIYGMNFDPEASPFNMPELRWYLGYPLCLSLMLVITLIELWLFWKRGWIFQKTGLAEIVPPKLEDKSRHHHGH